jgi:mediator of RNA polymerase II transcription subunit 24
MITIIKKMFYDVHPPMAGQAKMKSVPLPHALVSRAPINEILHDILASVHLRGWLDLKATYTFENLLCIGGPQWFVNTLVKKGLDFVHRTELQQSVDILFAIFQIDIEQCTLSLLVHCLPGLLQSEKRSTLLIEPRGSSLARFVAMCMFSALQSRHGAKGVKKRNNKRTRRDVEMEEMAHSIDFKRPQRSRCLVSGADIDDDIIGSTPGLNLQDPLHKAIAELFRLFSVLASDPVLSQRTQFVIFFLQQVVACGKLHAKNVLQFMPASLVPKLLKCLPEMFTIELLLGLCDTNTVFGRRLTAKVLIQLQNSKSHN